MLSIVMDKKSSSSVATNRESSSATLYKQCIKEERGQATLPELPVVVNGKRSSTQGHKSLDLIPPGVMVLRKGQLPRSQEQVISDHYDH